MLPIILEFKDVNDIQRTEVFQSLYFDNNHQGYPERYCINTHEVDRKTYEIAKREIERLYNIDVNVHRFYIQIS